MRCSVFPDGFPFHERRSALPRNVILPKSGRALLLQARARQFLRVVEELQRSGAQPALWTSPASAGSANFRLQKLQVNKNFLIQIELVLTS